MDKKRIFATVLRVYKSFDPLTDSNWYVDGDIASSGDGTTLATAFKTLAEAVSATSAGQSIWIQPFNDGSPYREGLDLSALDGVGVYSSLDLTFTRDGNGYITGYTINTAGAKIDCRDIIVNATFSKTDGLTNVYEKSVTFDTGITSPMVKVWEDGVNLTLVADAATCDGTAGSYYIADHTASPQTVYIHASDSSDITANAKEYEYNPRGEAIIFGNNCTIQGIHCLANLCGDGVLRSGDGLTASMIICEEGSKHNLYNGENSTITDFVLKNAYWSGTGATMAVYNKGTATGQDITYTRGLAVTDDGFGTNISGFHGHINVGGLFGTVIYDDVSCIGFNSAGAGGFLCTDAAHIYFKGCLTKECYQGYTLYDSDPTYHITNNASRNSRHESTIVGTRAVLPAAANIKLVIDGWDVDVSTANSSYGIAALTVASPIITVANCTITGKSGQTYGFRHTGTGGTISVTTTTFTTCYRFYHTAAGAAAITSDYNTFPDASADSQVEGTAYATVAAYQAATGQDAHSTVG